MWTKIASGPLPRIGLKFHLLHCRSALLEPSVGCGYLPNRLFIFFIYPKCASMTFLRKGTEKSTTVTSTITFLTKKQNKNNTYCKQKFGKPTKGLGQKVCLPVQVQSTKACTHLFSPFLNMVMPLASKVDKNFGRDRQGPHCMLKLQSDCGLVWCVMHNQHHTNDHSASIYVTALFPQLLSHCGLFGSCLIHAKAPHIFI